MGFSFSARGDGVSWHQTQTLTEVALGSNFSYFHDAISAVLRVLEHGMSSGIITFAQFDGKGMGCGKFSNVS